MLEGKQVMDRLVFEENKVEILPGVFFTLLALSWFLHYALARKRRASPSGVPPPPSCTAHIASSLPWSSLASLLLSGLAIISTVLLPSSTSLSSEQEQQAAILQRVTLYLGFCLPGLLNTLTFYSSIPIPKHLPLVATTLAFLLESSLLSTSSPLLLITMISCLLLSLARLLLSSSPSSPSCLLLCLLTQVQGSWLLHTSLSPPSPIWQATYFSWHVLATFILYTAALLIIQLILLKREEPKNPSPPGSSTSPSTSPASSSSTTLSSYSPAPTVPARPGRESELFYQQEVNDTKIEKIRSVLATIDDMMEGEGIARAESGSLDTSRDTLSEEEGASSCQGERVSPLEEWNTLHRCREQNRNSIRLKESNIV